MTMARDMYMYTSIDGHTILHFTKPPREVRESFEGGEGVSKGVTQYTTSGAITTSWTNALICDDYVWVCITHPYSSDEPMFANGTAARLARIVALEADSICRYDRVRRAAAAAASIEVVLFNEDTGERTKID